MTYLTTHKIDFKQVNQTDDASRSCKSQFDGRLKGNLFLHKRNLLFLLLVCILSVSIQAQTYVPITVTGFNHDLIANGAGGFNRAAATTTTTFDNVNIGADNVMYSTDFRGNTNPNSIPSFGLPMDRKINSGNLVGANYLLAPYNENNTLVLKNSNESGTLVLGTPGVFSRIAFLGASAEGSSSFSVTLNFSDGTNTVSSFTVPDWFNGANFAIKGIGRVSRTQIGAQNPDVFTGDSENPRLYDNQISLTAPDNAKILTSITFTKTSPSGSTAILAINGITAVNAPMAPIATAATNILSSRFTATWMASPGATGYYLDVSTSPTFITQLSSYNNLSVGDVLSQSVTGLSNNTDYYYRIRASNVSGISPSSNTIAVKAECLGSIDPTAKVLTCTTTSIVLDASKYGGDDSFWQWSTGAFTTNISVTSPGTYTVTVSSGSPICATIVITENKVAPIALLDTIEGTQINCLTSDLLLDASISEEYRVGLRLPSINTSLVLERDDSGQWDAIDNLREGEQSIIQSNAISLSENGSRVAVIEVDSAGTSSSVKVYEWVDNEWLQLGNKINLFGSDDEDGYSMDLSGDGKRIIIGSPRSNADKGEVSIYQYDGTEWIKNPSIIKGENPGDLFGKSVSMSNDGKWISIGAPGISEAYVFLDYKEINGSDYGIYGMKISGLESGDQTGSVVSLKGGGFYVAVSSPNYMNGKGLVRFLKDGPTGWEQIGNAMVGDKIGDRLGETMALSQDGSTIIPGAPAGNYASVYRFDGVSWTVKGLQIRSSQSLDQTGSSVAISGNGDRILVGAGGYKAGSGLLRLFSFNKNQWYPMGEDIEEDEPDLGFGLVSDLSSIGSRKINYLWTGGQTASSINVTEGGIYAVTLTDQENGCTNQTSVIVKKDITPVTIIIDIKPTNILTCTSDSIKLNAETVFIGDYDYVWSNGETTKQIIVTNPGDYFVTVTDNSSKCFSSRSMSIEQNITPTTAIINSGGVVLIDATNPSITLDASGSLGAGLDTLTFEWSTGEMGTNIEVVQGGIYSVTVTNPLNGCSNVAFIEIFGEKCKAVIMGAGTLTCVVDKLTLVASDALGANPASIKYLWSTGSTSSSIDVNTQGSYWVNIELTDGSACTDTAFVQIMENRIEPEALIISDSGFVLNCIVRSITLDAQFSNAQGTKAYAWSNGSNSASISVANGGFYSVTVTDAANGCTSISGIEVKDENPVINISSNSPICSGDTLRLVFETPGATYSWTGPGGYISNLKNPIRTNVDETLSGVYFGTVTLSNGCVYTKSLTIVINKIPVVSIIYADTICAGSNIQLSETGNQAVTWQWTGPGGVTGVGNILSIQDVAIVNSGVYTVNIEDVNGCRASASLPLSVSPAPKVEIKAEGSLCAGSTLLLTETGGEASQWNWSGPGNFSATGKAISLIGGQASVGIYTLVASNDFGCITSVAYDVKSAGGEQIETNFLVGGVACVGDTLRFIDYSKLDIAEGVQFAWDFGTGDFSTERDPLYRFPASGVFEVTLTLSNSECSGIIVKKRIEIVECRRGYINNQFSRIYPTPSDGEVNIELSLPKLGDMSVKIYNVNGQKILSKTFQDVKDLIEKIFIAEKGVYFIEIYHDYGIERHKTIVVY